MKRISFFLAAALLAAPVVLRAQDAALEEQVKKLGARIQDLADASEAQNKRIEALQKQLDALQQQQGKPNATYASAEDVKVLAAKLKEIEQNRQHDNDLIVEKLKNLGKTLSAPPAGSKTSASTATSGGGDNAPPARREDGYYYTVKADDTPIAIAKAYNDQGVKVTWRQILAANPGLKAENLKPGQKIFIPASPQ